MGCIAALHGSVILPPIRIKYAYSVCSSDDLSLTKDGIQNQCGLSSTPEIYDAYPCTSLQEGLSISIIPPSDAPSHRSGCGKSAMLLREAPEPLNPHSYFPIVYG